MWSFVSSGPLPLYKQVVQRIEILVTSGKLPPGERLPAERVLARLMEVNRSTIIRALDELTDRGVLWRKRGSGTYVSNDRWGVQNYAMSNWQGPSAPVYSRTEAAFRRNAAIAREKALQDGVRFDDLSGDGLARDLLPDIPTPATMWEEAVAAEQGNEAAYLGLTSFRKSVQEYLAQTAGFSVPLEEILITSGSRQALFLIIQCLLKPGDAVGIEAPSYCYSLPIFQAAGLRLFALPMDGEGVVPEGLERVANRHSLKMIFLNPVFHNPTGTVMADARKKIVLDFCAKARIPIVEDDAYSQLYFESMCGLSPVKAYDARGQVMYTGSLSSYAGGNLRAGWLVAPRPVITRLADARLMMDAGLSVMPQILATAYLDSVAATHLPRLRAALASRAEAMTSRICTILSGDVEMEPPRGGLYCYPRLGVMGEKAYAAAQEAFVRHGLLPALGESFGDARRAFRFNISLFHEKA